MLVTCHSVAVVKLVTNLGVNTASENVSLREGEQQLRRLGSAEYRISIESTILLVEAVLKYRSIHPSPIGCVAVCSMYRYTGVDDEYGVGICQSLKYA